MCLSIDPLIYFTSLFSLSFSSALSEGASHFLIHVSIILRDQWINTFPCLFSLFFCMFVSSFAIHPHVQRNLLSKAIISPVLCTLVFFPLSLIHNNLWHIFLPSFSLCFIFFSSFFTMSFITILPSFPLCN